VSSQQTLQLNVYQEYNQPKTDTLYIKCSLSVEDRVLLGSLLNNESLIIEMNFCIDPNDHIMERQVV
jgi:hypothetical protein